jgi:alanine racemase
MSHLAAADNADDPKNKMQLATFTALRRLVPGARASLAASDGLMLGTAYHFDLVRPGYALYGGQPSRHHRAPVEPVVTVHARILQVRDVPRGETVGYSGIWEARRPSRIATVAAGYADGIPRSASRASDGPGGRVALGGHLAPIVGRVTMDLVTVDVTGLPPHLAQPGAWVELVGETISLEDAGAAAGTIGYEILTRLGRRFHRVYLGGG